MPLCNTARSSNQDKALPSLAVFHRISLKLADFGLSWYSSGRTYYARFISLNSIDILTIPPFVPRYCAARFVSIVQSLQVHRFAVSGFQSSLGVILWSFWCECHPYGSPGENLLSCVALAILKPMERQRGYCAMSTPVYRRLISCRSLMSWDWTADVGVILIYRYLCLC